MLALPVLAIPALVRGAVDRNLLETAIAGLAIFAVAAGIGALLLSTDRPLAWIGRLVAAHPQPAAARAPSRCPGSRSGCCASATACSTRSGRSWKRALAATVGRWLFDYATLRPRWPRSARTRGPGLVLLAFCGARVLAQIPVTPGRPRVRRGGPDRDARAGRRERRATR